MRYEEEFILESLKEKLTIKEKILLYLFKKYTYKIYVEGIKKGFDWHY